MKKIIFSLIYLSLIFSFSLLVVSNAEAMQPAPTKIPQTLTGTPYPTYFPTSTVMSNDSSGSIVILALLGGLGFGGYKLAKRLLQKKKYID